MGMRAALYFRVSTARQAEKDLSIPDQRRQAQAYCRAKGLCVAREFEERGASATDDKRPVFQDMVEAASRPDRVFDVILVHSYSRFFRDAFQLEFYLRRLQKNGVTVVSITQETGDDPMSQLVRKILALFDEYQSKENGKHTLRAMKENARQGFWNGSRPPYGYRTSEVERRGDKIKRCLEIEPSEAEIVRLIYRLHLEGAGSGQLGIKAIADQLNRKRIQYRDGRRFSKSLVYDLLTRETYTGRHWFNRTDSKTGAVKPRDEWIALPVPPIVDEETYRQAKASLANRSPRVIAPRVVNSPVLLTGLARCATCGGAMTLRTGKSGRYRYYTCSTCAQLGKTACKGRTLPMALLDNLVLDHLTQRLFTSERLSELLTAHLARSQGATSEWAQKGKEADRELHAVDEATRRLLELVERGIAPLDDLLGNRLSELRQRREEAIRLKAAAARQRQSPKSGIAPDQLEAFCASMRERLLSADTATRQSYLRLFVERIDVDDAEVRMGGRNDRLEAGLRPRLGGPSEAVPSFVPRWRPRPDSNGRPTV
jgi:site-specific DNA recombinase